VGAQLALSLLPWLALRPIGALEAVAALSAGGTAFLGLAAAGLLFSVRFPQKARGQGNLSQIPFALLLVPTAVTAILFAGLALVWRLTGAFAPLAFVALFALGVAIYSRCLPRFLRLWDNRVARGAGLSRTARRPRLPGSLANIASE
jgi:hypothetical protein